MLTRTLRRLETLLDGASFTVAQRLAMEVRNAGAEREALQGEIAASQKHKTDGGDGAPSAALDEKKNALWKLDAKIKALCRMEAARRVIHDANATKETYDACETMVQAWEKLDLVSESSMRTTNRKYHLEQKRKHEGAFNTIMNRLNGVVSAAQVESCRREFATTVKPLDVPAMINHWWP